jgi:hypothetical protein
MPKVQYPRTSMSHPILSSLVGELPGILAALGGTATGVVLWKRAPLSSLLLVIACSSSVVLLLLYPLAYELLAGLTSGNDRSGLNFVVRLLWSIFRATYLVLLIVAVYAGRNHTEHQKAQQANKAITPLR